MDIFKLIVTDDDTDEIGVNYVAFVDKPATGETFIAFKEETPTKYEFQEVDQEKGVVMGALMVANLPILRKREDGTPYLVVLDPENIDKAMAKFSRKGNQKNVNEMHDPTKKVSGVYMQYAWPINKELGMPTPKGFNEVPDGSVFAYFKVDNLDIREKIKNGTFQGFSIEGMFIEQPIIELTKEDEANFLDALEGSNL